MQHRRRIWLDADPGLDDWLTMLLLASQDYLDWVGMGVVAGNAPVAVTLDNALRIRALHGLEVPIHAGAAQPLSMPLETAQAILGEQGMRTTGPELALTTQACDGADAVHGLLQALRQGGGPSGAGGHRPVDQHCAGDSAGPAGHGRCRRNCLDGRLH